jgi:hypothetical protein
LGDFLTEVEDGFFFTIDFDPIFFYFSFLITGTCSSISSGSTVVTGSTFNGSMRVGGDGFVDGSNFRSDFFGYVFCSVGRHDEVMFDNGEENEQVSDGGEGKIRIWKFRSFESMKLERVVEITCSS